MVLEALKPAVPRDVQLDEKNRRIMLKVAEEDLAIAIGRKGQNARLTSRLIGWKLDIEEFKAESSDPRATALQALVRTFGLDAAIAGRLVAIGINSPAAFEGVSAEDLTGSGFTAEEAQAIILQVGGSDSAPPNHPA